MADNVAITQGSGTNIAADEATYSGDTAKIQLARLVHVTGSEGSKTVEELVRAEDTAHSTGHNGIPVLGVRQDTAASLAGTDGDYTMPIFDSTGKMHVNVGNTVTVGSHAVTNAGTFAVQESGSALTALQTIDNPVLVDDAAFTPASSSVMMAGFEYDDTTPDSVNEGDAGAARMSANRNQYVQLRDAAGNERGANVNASNQLSVSIDNSPVLGAGTNNIGDVDILSLPNEGQQTMANSISVAIASDQSAVATTTVGTAAHGAVDSGAPIKIGAKIESSLKGITTEADQDRTDLYADVDGQLMVKLNTNFGDLISERVSDTGGTSTAFTNFSAVASTRNYVTAITVYNSSATGGYVDFRDGTGGSVLWTMPIPAGGGSVIATGMPLFRTSTNTALAYDVSGALTTVYISVSGFQSKA